MKNLFKNSKIKTLTSAILLVCLSSFSFNANAFAQEVTLPAGTRIDLETVSTVSSEKIQVGESVDFKVRADVTVDGKVVVRAGSIAKGVVMSSKKARGIGREGSIEVQVKSVQAVDGKSIPLSGSGIARQGDDKSTLSIVLGIFVCLLFLLLKGKNGEIPAGSATDAIVASNIKVTVQ